MCGMETYPFRLYLYARSLLDGWALIGSLLGAAVVVVLERGTR